MAAATPLEWDSEFFGFPVGEIDLRQGCGDLAALRDEIASSGYRLCYVLTHDADGDATAAAIGATLVDRRTLMQRSLDHRSVEDRRDSEEDFASSTDLARVRSLALQSAEFSRFRTDHRMPPDAWLRMYERWADNSMSGTMADAVLVARINGDVVGVLTVSSREDLGKIGLFAVDAAARGRGLGAALLARGAAWFARRGCQSVLVVTQGDNIGAQRVYERAGYVIAAVTNVDHLWLPDRVAIAAHEELSQKPNDPQGQPA